MAREANRPPIEDVLAALREAWTAPGNEDMRLGQLLANALRLAHDGAGPPGEVLAALELWNIYDERWIDALQRFARR